MKKTKRKPHVRPRGGVVQYFEYGPFRFNVNKAIALAADRRKYPLLMRRPSPDWIGPGIEIDAHHVDDADLTQQVIFATLVQNGQSWPLLIDGNHRVAKALRQQAPIPVVTLDLADTLKVMAGPLPMVQQMKREGARLGLILDDGK